VVVRADSDYYDLLGVARGADKKTIKSAYRQKARKFHPVSILALRGPQSWHMQAGQLPTDSLQLLLGTCTLLQHCSQATVLPRSMHGATESCRLHRHAYTIPSR
jgi:hypothetical protein